MVLGIHAIKAPLYLPDSTWLDLIEVIVELSATDLAASLRSHLEWSKRETYASPTDSFHSYCKWPLPTRDRIQGGFESVRFPSFIPDCIIVTVITG